MILKLLQGEIMTQWHSEIALQYVYATQQRITYSSIFWNLWKHFLNARTRRQDQISQYFFTKCLDIDIVTGCRDENWCFHKILRRSHIMIRFIISINCHCKRNLKKIKTGHFAEEEQVGGRCKKTKQFRNTGESISSSVRTEMIIKPWSRVSATCVAQHRNFYTEFLQSRPRLLRNTWFKWMLSGFCRAW